MNNNFTIPGYKIIKELGSGSMGSVYKALHEKLDRFVAIKVLKKSYCDDPAIKSRFLNEAKAFARLKHNNIVSIYHIDEISNIPYFEMELVEGFDLGQYIKQNKERKSEQDYIIAEQILNAISYAHNKGIIHRDIKPENILINKQNQVKIIDFGLAKIFDIEQSITSHGEILGSPMYISPEQIKGETCSFQADIYSLGVVFFYLFSGYLPYKANSISELLYKRVNIDPLPFNPRVKDLNPNLKDFIFKMMEKDLNSRFANVASVKKEFLNLQKKAPCKKTFKTPKIPKKIFLILLATVFLLLITSLLKSKLKTSSSSIVYQDFEGNFPIEDFGFSLKGKADLIKQTDKFYKGKKSWKNVFIKGLWNQTTIYPSKKYLKSSISLKEYDRLVFSVFAIPQHTSNNNVGVVLYDNNNFSGGFTVWTSHNATYRKWTQLHVLFSQLPEDFDIKSIQKIEFKQYWEGEYYLDNIRFIQDKRVYQSFEKDKIHIEDNQYEFGWIWNKKDQCRISINNEPVYEGKHSFKLISKDSWGGVGIASENKKCIKSNEGKYEQQYWNVDLNPLINDKLVFWVYALPDNKKDQRVNVQFFDHNKHNTIETKFQIYTKYKAKCNSWTKLSIDFKKLPKSLNLRNLNKIQIQFKDPGIYYLDNLIFVNSQKDK